MESCRPDAVVNPYVFTLRCVFALKALKHSVSCDNEGILWSLFFVPGNVGGECRWQS